MDLLEDLGVGTGMTAVVGAGGKKTTLYALADRIERAVVTSTVRIPFFDEHVAAVRTTPDPATAVQTVEQWPIGLVADREESRYVGYDPAVVSTIETGDTVDAVLVKADGARNREFKAPGEDEPRIPPAADRVLAIASVHVVGEPLDEPLVHRPERVSEITGLERGERIGVEDVAAVLASEDGGLKNVPDGAELIPMLNKVDDEDLEETARAVAGEILDRGPIERVALTRMIAPDDEQLVDVVTR